MPPKKYTPKRRDRRTPTTVEAVVERLPERFIKPTLLRSDERPGTYDTPKSLRSFVWDLDQWLERENISGIESADLLGALGIPVADWYQAANS
ncbi:hypothetical protein nbrc107696_23990 [Gordonia spumicola]|uniref:Uncharacterized protein n=1 Tax=Gordonia spumicola TaxID=589161 RepID=A0A7I9VA48_9ACTN|nr:hypothetical protein nbrc107696_23990 [Gordonia spumicola]